MEKAYRKLEASVTEGLLSVVRLLERVEKNLMSVVDDLKMEVAKNRDVTASAVALLQQLTSKLQSAASNQDLDKINEILNEVRMDSQVLGEAVAANTVAAAAPSEPVTPAP